MFPESFLMLKTKNISDIYPESFETQKEVMQMDDKNKERGDEKKKVLGVSPKDIKKQKCKASFLQVGFHRCVPYHTVLISKKRRSVFKQSSISIQ